MIDIINLFTGKIIDFILLPFKSLGEDWEIFIISAISGVLLIFVYGLVSNQKAIKKLKRKISASILEVILYRHDIKLCLKAQLGMLISGAKYFLLAVPPLIILMVPCLLILSQMNLRYEQRPLNVGESLLLSAKVKDPNLLMDTTLQASDAVSISEPVRVPEEKEITWKINAKEKGSQTLVIQNKNQKIDKKLFIEQAGEPLYSQLYNSSIWTLLYPRNDKSFISEFSEIKLTYPANKHYLFNFELHWILIFFIVSMVSGLIASKFFKVEI